MIKKTYCSEIEALLIQFVTAFDDCRIVRYDKSSDTSIEVLPRWVVAPKTRVFTDIINQAGNITLPVAVVNVKGISLRKDDFFNKQLDQRKWINGIEYRSWQPIPISINVTVHFYTKFISEIWQLMSNFASFTKPYIFLSWQNPTYLKKDFIEEVRSKISWDGTFNINIPESLSEDQQWILEGTAGFTIEGFLFEPDTDTHGLITSVKNYLGNNRYTTQYLTEEGILDFYEKDGWPSVTNIFSSEGFRYNKDINPVFHVKYKDTITFEGRSFFKDKNTGILIVKDDGSTITGLSQKTINTIKMGDITGYALDSSIEDDNHISFTFPNIESDFYNIIIYNKAGYIKLDIIFSQLSSDQYALIEAGTYVISDLTNASNLNDSKWSNSLYTFNTDTFLKKNSSNWINKVIWNTNDISKIDNTATIDRTNGTFAKYIFDDTLTDNNSKFYKCTFLTGDYISNLQNTINGSSMFRTAGLYNFYSDMPSLTDSSFMFHQSYLQSFNASLPKLKNSTNMFSESEIKQFESNNLSSLEDGTEMFSECENLEQFKAGLPALKTGKNMFYKCKKLSAFKDDLSSLENGNSMFENCINLLDFDSKLSNLSNGYNMFGSTILKIESIISILESLPIKISHGPITLGSECYIGNEIKDTKMILETEYSELLKTVTGKNWIILYHG